MTEVPNRESLQLEFLQLRNQKMKAQIKEQELDNAKAKEYLREARAQADEAEVKAKVLLENEKKRLAKDEYAHVYVFSESVRDASVKNAVNQLAEWSRMDPGCDIEIVFNSPGGSVTDGMHLYDHIQALRAAGHNVTTVALGMAASMAGILLQAGTTRVMGKEAYILIHEVSAGAIGKIGEIEDEVELLKMMTDRAARIFASRSTLNVAQIKNRMRRKDWWIDSDTALKLKLVDEVRG